MFLKIENLGNLGEFRMGIAEFMEELNFASDLPKNSIFAQVAPSIRTEF